MKKIKFSVNLLDVKEVFSNLKASKGFPEAPAVDIELELDDITQNYEYLCQSPLILNWAFVEEPEKVEVEEPSDEGYQKIKAAFEGAEINMKDVRDIIMVSDAYLCVSEDKGEKDLSKIVDEVVEYYQANKETIKEKVYSEEFITRTIKALSQTTNPLADFIQRIEDWKHTDTSETITFEYFYRSLYSQPVEEVKGDDSK